MSKIRAGDMVTILNSNASMLEEGSVHKVDEIDQNADEELDRILIIGDYCFREEMVSLQSPDHTSLASRRAKPQGKPEPTLEKVVELYDFLSRGELPDGITIDPIVKMGDDAAFGVIWFLQEHLDLIDTHIEQCSSCKALFDSSSEGHYNDETGNHYCEACREANSQEDNCPDCGAPARATAMQEGGGVECSKKCGWWFCF